jgi:hypothetical protein
MTINPEIIAAYAPWGNAELAFEVATSQATLDAATGNYIFSQTTLNYLAALSIQPPNWRSASGADQTLYTVTGRLLSPSTLDPRISNGSQAVARINGLVGRFELVFDLNMDQAARIDLRQMIQGTFRVTGGG